MKHYKAKSSVHEKFTPLILTDLNRVEGTKGNGKAYQGSTRTSTAEE